jgi:hypothetical protein
MSSSLTRLQTYVVNEMGDPNAPVPAAVAFARLKILGRNLFLVVLVAAAAVALSAPAYPAVADGLMLAGIGGGLYTRCLRGKLAGKVRGGVLFMSAVVFVSSIVINWFANPSSGSFRAVFGIAAGPIARSLLANLIPIVIGLSVVVTLILEVKLIVTEVRSVQSRDDTHRLIAELSRLRRGRMT